MNNATAAESVEPSSETRLRVVRRSEEQHLEAEAWEVLAQLELLQEALDARLEDGVTEVGAPAVALRATVRKLRAALP